MATMSIRGLDDKVLARLKRMAEQEGGSLNSLVLRLLQNADTAAQTNKSKKYDDLNALAGTWSEDEALDFERNTAAFAEVYSALWQ